MLLLLFFKSPNFQFLPSQEVMFFSVLTSAFSTASQRINREGPCCGVAWCQALGGIPRSIRKVSPSGVLHSGSRNGTYVFTEKIKSLNKREQLTRSNNLRSDHRGWRGFYFLSLTPPQLRKRKFTVVCNFHYCLSVKDRIWKCNVINEGLLDQHWTQSLGKKRTKRQKKKCEKDEKGKQWRNRGQGFGYTGDVGKLVY